jgi:hypothetical protein
MVPESSAICAGSSRGRPHEPLPLFDIEHEIGLSAHQLLRGRGAVEVGRDQLLDFEGLKPNVAPQPGDILIEQNEVAVHRSLRAAVTVSDEWRSSAFEPGGCLP